MKHLIRNILGFAICMMCIVSVSSCRSSKKAKTDTDVTVVKPTDAVDLPSKPNRSLSPTEKLLLTVDSTTNVNYTAKVNVKLMTNGKSISTNGSLKMRWNDVIQISLVDPLFGIKEIGRMEFSRDNVLVIDRINMQYMDESYASLSKLTKTELTYEYVQALFWSESQKKNNENISYKIPLKQPVALDLKVSNVGHKESWDAHTEVSSRYSKVSAEQLFKSLSQM